MYGIDKDGKNIGVDDPAIRTAEGQKKLDEAVRAIETAVLIAQGIADTYGLEFRYVPDHIGTYFGKGSDADGKYDDGAPEGEWYPSYWNSSSAFC